MTYMSWRRELAVSESMALRALVRLHGRMPVLAPLRPEWRQYVGHCNNSFTGDAA